MSFKTYLQNLSWVQTFQLYILVAIAIIYPYFLLINSADEKTIYDNKNLINIKKSINEIHKKIETPNFIKVLKEFEKEATKYKTLKIENFITSDKSIKLNGISKEDDLLKFILFCENYSNTSALQSLQFKESAQKLFYTFSFTIEFKKIYMKTISSEKLKEQFEKISLLTKVDKNQFTLQGIVNDTIIINDKLLSVNDTIGNYKIEKISSDHVILSKDSIKKVLYLKGDINVR